VDPRAVQDFVINFTSILWEAFPFVILGALIAGILEEMVPQQTLTKLIPKSRTLAIGIGGLLGLVFPMCECGIVPVMRRLLRKGMPLGTCVAYMLAGPIINLVVITSTAVAFGPHGIGAEMVLLRCGMGFVIACTTAFLVQRQYDREGPSLLTPLAAPLPTETPLTEKAVSLDVLATPDVHPAEARAGQKRSAFQRIANISETSLHDFTDIMLFLTLGSLMAATAKMFLSPTDVASLSGSFSPLLILAMMGLAVVMCLCSEADAFVAASFTTLAPAPKLAFLVLGPMFDLKLLLMFTRVFRKRLIVTIVISVVVQTFIYANILNMVWSENVSFLNPPAAQELQTPPTSTPQGGN